MDRKPETTERNAIGELFQFLGNVRQAIAPTVEELYERALSAYTASPRQDDVFKECILKLFFSFKTADAKFKAALLYWFYVKDDEQLCCWWKIKGFYADRTFSEHLNPYVDIFGSEMFLLLIQEINAQFKELKEKEIKSEKEQQIKKINVLLEAAFADSYFHFFKSLIKSESPFSCPIMKMFWNVAQSSYHFSQKYLENAFYEYRTSLFFDIFIPFISNPQHLMALDARACEQFAKAYGLHLNTLEHTKMQRIDDSKKEEFKAYYNIVLTHGVSLENQYCIEEHKKFQEAQRKLWHYTEISASSSSSENGSVVVQTWEAPFSAAQINGILELLGEHFELAQNILDAKLMSLNSAIQLRKAILYKIYTEEVVEAIEKSDFHTDIAPHVITLDHIKRSLLAHVALHALIKGIKIAIPTQLDVTDIKRLSNDNVIFFQAIYHAGYTPLSMTELSLFISALNCSSAYMNDRVDELMALHPSYVYLYGKHGEVTNENNAANLSSTTSTSTSHQGVITNYSGPSTTAGLSPGTIPEDIWSQVVRHLPVQSLYRLSATCTLFRRSSVIPNALREKGQHSTKVSIEYDHSVLCTCGSIYTTKKSSNSAPLAQHAVTINSVWKPIPLSAYARLIVKGIHTSFILTLSGKLYAFGSSKKGQLGLGNTQYTDIPTLVHIIEPVDSVRMGDECAFAITCSGKLYAWGNNEHGQLGLEHIELTNTPSRVRINERVKSVVCQGQSTFAVTHNGKLYAWGNDNTYRPSTRSQGPLFPVIIYGNNAGEKKPELIKSCVAVNANFFVITGSGKLYSWGGTHDSGVALGLKYVSFRPYQHNVPQLVTIDEPLQSVVPDFEMTFAITCSGKLYVWGKNNGFGVFGTEIQHGAVASTPVLVPISEPVQSVVIDSSSVFAITCSGKLYVWGRNDRGQLGLGHSNNVYVPTLISIAEAVQWVASRYGSTFIFTHEGNLYACGDNRNNRLALPNAGVGEATYYHSPQKVDYMPAPSTEHVYSTGFKHS